MRGVRRTLLAIGAVLAMAAVTTHADLTHGTKELNVEVRQMHPTPAACTPWRGRVMLATTRGVMRAVQSDRPH